MKTRTIFLPINFVIQSTLYNLRERTVAFGFDTFSRLYVKVKRNEPWGISRKELLKLQPESLGFHLGCFLLKHNLHPQPRCEDHDVFHVITGYSTDTDQEIAMQFFLFGNGKRSPFLNLARLCGYLLYPDRYSYFKEALKKGAAHMPLHVFDYKQHLNTSVKLFKKQ
ncbi:MAG: hypothetical protein WBG71_12285 [Leeuwenhoekiella sp.]